MNDAAVPRPVPVPTGIEAFTPATVATVIVAHSWAVLSSSLTVTEADDGVPTV